MKIHIHNNLILISMIVFLFLNMIENIIHFSIGRNIDDADTASIKLEIPNTYDIIKIIFIMGIFAVLQAFLTYYGLKYL
jgi:hypothetical protein